MPFARHLREIRQSVLIFQRIKRALLPAGAVAVTLPPAKVTVTPLLVQLPPAIVSDHSAP